MSNVGVLGSINVDTTLHVDRIPQPGETIHVQSKSSAGGGKGANQAVSAIRNGAKVKFIGSVGKDADGVMMRDLLKAEGIDVECVLDDEKNSTGTATILLDEEGQNSILVYPGSNDSIRKSDIDEMKEELETLDILIAQFETPKEATLEAFKIAKENEVITILNPAPASEIASELLAVTDVIAPNETEAEVLTGIKVESVEDMHKVASYFHEKGVSVVLITLGSRGVFLSSKDTEKIIPAFKVKPVDTTAAGDTFIGSMASKLKVDLSNIEEAIVYGQQASSIAVQKPGAIPSIPKEDEVTRIYNL